MWVNECCQTSSTILDFTQQIENKTVNIKNGCTSLCIENINAGKGAIIVIGTKAGQTAS